MQIPRKYLYPIVTAVLFPIVLTGSMWALDEFTGEEWLPWTKVNVSSHQAVKIAESKCFAQSPSYLGLRPWRTKLRDGRWFVTGTKKGRYWTWPAASDALAYALIDSKTGALLNCSLSVIN